MRSALDQMGPDDEPLIQDAASTDGTHDQNGGPTDCTSAL
jgi:hypothetical protein